MFIISGEFEIKPEYRDELKVMSKNLVSESLKEAGCISYAFYENSFRKNHFLFFERWKTREDIVLHFEKTYFKDFSERFPQMATGQSMIEIHSVNNTEQV